MNVHGYERTLYEARLDASYNVLLNEMQENLYCRADKLIVGFSLLAGTSAFGGAVGKLPLLVAVAGVLVAIASVVGAINDFAGRAEKHRGLRRRYAELYASDITDLAVYDRELAKIGIDDVRPLKSIDVAAFNANLRRNGRLEYLLPEPRFVRAVAFVC